MNILDYLKYAIIAVIIILLLLLAMNLLKTKKSLDNLNKHSDYLKNNLEILNKKKAYIESVKEKIFLLKSIVLAHLVIDTIKDVKKDKDDTKKMAKDIAITSIKSIPKLIKK